MKAKDVLKILNISRITLMKYLKLGYISATKLPNGQYDYNDDTVYAFIGQKKEKKNIVQGNFDGDKVVYAQSLEELGINETFYSFKELYDKVKKSKVRYRFPLENCSYAVFRKKHIKTYQTLYKFV